jgi:hypothetical protein
MAAQSTGMMKRQGFLVDEATILANGVAKSLTGGAKAQGLNIGAYFSSDAAGSVSVADQGGTVLATIAAPSGGGKVIVERGRFEVYDATSVVLDTANLSAGSVQVSLY